MPLPSTLPLARLARDSVVAETPQGLGKLRIVGGDHSAFAGRDVFHRMEAEHRHIGNAPDRSPAVLRAESVAGVFDDYQSMFLRNFSDRSQVCRMPRIVDRKHSLRLRRNLLRKLLGIKIESVLADIRKNWPRPLIENAIG